MQGQNSYGYIHIGLLIRLLQNIKAGIIAKFAKEHISVLKQELEKANFNVCLAAMEGSKYSAMMEDLTALEDNEVIGSKLAEEINVENSALERVVYAEAATKKLYVIPSRRFNSDYLLNRPEKLFSKGTFNKLDKIAKLDISSSCRCLLFGEATASAFHILRATEAVLKSYYFHHRKRNRLDKPMWANMLDQLKAKTRNKPPATLLNSLDLIRTAYRNPTQHPQATCEIDSAQDLFGVCLDAIGKMSSEL